MFGIFVALAFLFSLLSSVLTAALFQNDHPICSTYCGVQCKNYYYRGGEWEWMDCIKSRIYCKCSTNSLNNTDQNTLFDFLMVAPGIVLICLLLCCCYCKIKSMPKNVTTKSAPSTNKADQLDESCNKQGHTKSKVASKTQITTANTARENHSPVAPIKSTNERSELSRNSGCVVDMSFVVESLKGKNIASTRGSVSASMDSYKRIEGVE